MSAEKVEQLTQELEEKTLKITELTDLVSDKEQAAQVSAKLAADREEELKALQEKFDTLQTEADASANEVHRLKEELAKRPQTAEAAAPVKEVAARSKFTTEEHLDAAVEGLEARQAGEMACPEWREALVSAKQAQTWCGTRTSTRIEQGIVDESKQHIPSIR